MLASEHSVTAYSAPIHLFLAMYFAADSGVESLEYFSNDARTCSPANLPVTLGMVWLNIRLLTYLKSCASQLSNVIQ